MKLWSITTADRKIREWVYKRDNYQCVFPKCGKKQKDGWRLNPSHYWGRRASALRFDPKNIDTVCAGCHIKHESNKQGFYREWKMKQLGTAEYKKLEKRFYQEKITRSDAIKKLMEFLNVNFIS